MNPPGADELLEVLPRCQGRRVVVVGDLILDEYIVGRPARISREAPVVILEFERRFFQPGGGTSPAYSIQALGGRASPVGVVGDDAAGEHLVESLRQLGVEVTGVRVDPSRPTTTKTRLVAQAALAFPQQIARVDRLDRRPLAAAVEAEVVGQIRRLSPAAEAILVSDYKTGVVSPGVMEAASEAARTHAIPITVDSQGDLHKFRGCTVVKCNQQEAESFLHTNLDQEAIFPQALEHLQAELEARTVIITRGPDGMSVFDRQHGYYYLPAANRSEVFDVTGAGDTVIAVLTLALAGGADLLQAAMLANLAAGVVVRKLGNATTGREELEQAIRQSTP